MVKYKVIKRDSEYNLSAEVNEMMGDGWEPIGGAYFWIVDDPFPKEFWVQTMMKKENAND